MRIIYVLPLAILGILLSLPFHVAFKAARKKDEYKGWFKAWRYVRKYFKFLLFLAGTKVEVRGQENIPDDGPVLFVGNHQSYFDIIITQTLSKTPMGFIAKKEFLKYPFLNLFMTDIGCVFLDRSNPKEGLKSINEGIDHMKKGLSIGLFPEGTRNHSPELLPFKEGGYRIAEKSKRPIVVMALSGVDGIFEANKHMMIKKRHVIVEYDKPVNPSELTADEKKAFYASIPERIMELKKDHVL